MSRMLEYRLHLKCFQFTVTSVPSVSFKWINWLASWVASDSYSINLHMLFI